MKKLQAQKPSRCDWARDQEAKLFPKSFASTGLAAGLAGRLRSLVAAIDRLDRLEAGSGEWKRGFAEGELNEAATEITLRALRVVADPTRFSILKLLAAEDSQPVGALMQATGIGRLVLSEHLNDLVQVGLATRLIDTDHAQITAAGASVAEWLDGLIRQVAQSYLEAAGIR